MPSTKSVILDGSTLEGGGQLVRVALSLSAITGIPISLYNIRANRGPPGPLKGKHDHHGGRSVSGRDKGKSHGQTKGGDAGARGAGAGGARKVKDGLKESHLAAVLWLAKSCDAYVQGAEVSSRTLEFVGGAGYGSRSGSKAKGVVKELVDHESDTIELQNPGSVFLILQALLPYLIFGRRNQSLGVQDNRAEGENDGEDKEQFTEVTLRGGTNVPKSMSGDYVQLVLLPMLELIGLPKIEVDVVKRGWAGNTAATIGEVRVRVPSPPLGGFVLPTFNITERGEIEKISVKIVAGFVNARSILEEELQKTISEHFGEDMAVEMLEAEDSGAPQRLYVLLIAHTTNGWRLGRDVLGSGKLSKNAAEEKRILTNACQTVVRELKSEVKRGGCVDEFMQDQLVIFQSLASGDSVVDGGKWETAERLKREKTHDELDESCGDESGSLHTRTVRWVCEQVLKKHERGIEFREGGACKGVGRIEGDVENVEPPAQNIIVEKLNKLRVST